MFKKLNISLCFYLILVVSAGSCVEPFEPEILGFEGVLVVDAKLTDEEKRHEVLLSRAIPFEIDSVSAERNANVVIVDDSGNTYDFEEVEAGRYLSQIAFSAKENQSYNLKIVTTDGTSYNSESVKTPNKSIMGELYGEREFTDKGDEGVSILLNNSSEGNLKYLRYEYEETYKITVPFYSAFEFDIVDATNDNTNPDNSDDDGRFFAVDIKPRIKDVSTCYNTKKSTEIILIGNESNSLKNLERFPIRFLNRNDYIISHRYSILVKQYSLTQDSHSYYTNLSDFSSSESVFSQIQPGFLEGNIFSSGNESQKVLGYFEVSSVSEQRIFFNYIDFFIDEPLPPYAINCEPIGAPALVTQPGHSNANEDGTVTVDTQGGPSPLIQGIQAGLFTYYATNENFEQQLIDQGGIAGLAPYYTKARVCGDCTVLGKTEVPDFWIE